MTLTDKQIRLNNLKLKELRKQMDTLSKQLDAIEDTDPFWIEKSENTKAEMFTIWEQIKQVKSL